MPIEPPDPLQIAAALRPQLDALAALAIENPERREYAEALDRMAGAAILIERGARLEGRKTHQ